MGPIPRLLEGPSLEDDRSMRMVTYLIRRLFLLLPTIVGVITITFLLFQALPVQYQLAAHYGNPPKSDPCAFVGTCQCQVENRNSVNYQAGTCQCRGSNATVSLTTPCLDPLYETDISKLGLNQPVWYQWAGFTYRALTLDWGKVENGSYVAESFSFMKNKPVTTVIGWMLPYTLELAGLSLFFILLIAIPVGNLAAVNRNRPIDQIARVVSFSGFALPAFLLGSLAITGIVLILLPSTGFIVHDPWCRSGEQLLNEFQGSWPSGQDGCYPGLGIVQSIQNGGYPPWLTGGYASSPTGFPTVDAAIHGQYWLAADTLIRLILPALVIAFGSVAGILRFVRNSMLEVMNLDFVRTARAKGVPEKLVTSRHAGRNSLNVTITVLGLTFAFFIGGFPIIEHVFQLWGVGQMLAYAVVTTSGGSLSFAIIFGSTILFTYLVVAANLIVDILYAYLDPRVRLG